jgi:hypothetical protein
MDATQQATHPVVPLALPIAEVEQHEFQAYDETGFGGSTQDGILLLVAMGHTLRGSQSPLALLSKDIIQHALAPAISDAFWIARCAAGLVTPPSIRARPNNNNVEAIHSTVPLSPLRAATRPFFLPPSAPLLSTLVVPKRADPQANNTTSCTQATTTIFRSLGGTLAERFARLDESALPDFSSFNDDVMGNKKRRLPISNTCM